MIEDLLLGAEKQLDQIPFAPPNVIKPNRGGSSVGIHYIKFEEQIEEERAALKSDGLTPVTKESFFAWKERRAKKK